jgi:hypothetical protein
VSRDFNLRQNGTYKNHKVGMITVIQWIKEGLSNLVLAERREQKQKTLRIQDAKRNG